MLRFCLSVGPCFRSGVDQPLGFPLDARAEIATSETRLTRIGWPRHHFSASRCIEPMHTGITAIDAMNSRSAVTAAGADIGDRQTGKTAIRHRHDPQPEKGEGTVCSASTVANRSDNQPRVANVGGRLLL